MNTNAILPAVVLVVAAVFSGELYAQRNAPLFILQKPEKTGLKFTNKVREDDSLHVLIYEYLYNGHGIGVGDFNNDGMDDVFISGNTTPNKLFLNKGDFRFEDISREAGIGGNGTWATGVSIADVNGDGLLDIYVCHSGKFNEADLANELFILESFRDGKPRFREQAKAYGLDAPGTQSTQAAFFDYDRDGDLDMFLLNHSIHTYSPFLNTRERRSTPDFRYGNRLFRNDLDDKGKFTDVTLQAGIINNALNYGLSVNISDINLDGWPDIYTTSDYSEHDCYYVNNGDGTFTQSLQKSFAHISKFSMGADIADFNNDGLPDVLTLDMLPEDNHRQKLLKGPDEYDQYHLLLDSGYYRQHMRNMLHLNRGMDDQGNVRFSEIGQLAGISNTDWSWAGLFADLNGDGWKDLVVTNGYLSDFTNMDFLKYTMADAQLSAAAKGNLNFKTYELVQKMPSNVLRNYVFENTGRLEFRDVTESWGLTTKSVSNAAAYADFDNDGDLDLIIGNNNAPVELWRNDLAHGNRTWLMVRLKGAQLANRFAYGAKLWLYAGETVQYQELFPVRGYQSTVTSGIYFSFPQGGIDSLVVEWPDGTRTVMKDIQPNQVLRIDALQSTRALHGAKARAGETGDFNVPRERLFSNAPKEEQIDFRHRENDFVDFKVEVLIPYQLSRMGPALAKGDVNGDGLEDLFFGGAIGQSGALLLQADNGTFAPSRSRPWAADAVCEDVNAMFFDADNDNDLDLYVVSGGNEYLDESPEFQDRLYLNDGSGVFTKALNALPAMTSNKHAVAAGDFDNDGDLDLFVGGRGRSGYFPLPSRSYVLRNDSENGIARFTDVTGSVNPDLQFAGMVTSANWADLTGDGLPELIIAGDWMPIRIFRNDKGVLTDVSKEAGTDGLYGQWNTLTMTDVDSDGDLDIALGNCGRNHQFKPSEKEPMTIHVADFDENGSLDPILCYYIQGTSYPLASRDELLDQIPALKKKYVKYADYADVTLDDIFSKPQREKAEVFRCTEAESILLVQEEGLKFSKRSLPIEAQFSTTQSILVDDIDRDGNQDLLLLGNFYGYRTQAGESDASFGLLLKGKGDGTFEAVSPGESGLFADGDVRHAVIVNTRKGRRLIVAKNDDVPQVIRIGK
jgi:hypothetical protein